MMSPSAETNDAEHPPRLTMDPRTSELGCVSSCGSISSPIALRVSFWAASCSGIHMPPGFSNLGLGRGAAATAVAVAVGRAAAVWVAGGDGGATGVGASGPHPAAASTRGTGDRNLRRRSMRQPVALGGARAKVELRRPAPERLRDPVRHFADDRGSIPPALVAEQSPHEVVLVGRHEDGLLQVIRAPARPAEVDLKPEPTGG